MATTKIELSVGTWSQISSGKCIAQAAGGAVLIAVSAVSPSERIGITIGNGEMFCNALEASCWAQSVSADCSVVVADEV